MFNQSSHHYPLIMITALALALSACSLGGLSADSGAEESVQAAATEPTSQPANEQNTADEAKAGSTLPIKEGACANSLMPLEVGNQWVFVQYDGLGTEAAAEGEPTPVPSSTMTWTVTQVESGEATIDAVSEDFGIDAEYTVACEDGAILTFPTFTMELSLTGGGGGSVDLNYENRGGTYLPSVETLEANDWDYDWNSELVVFGNLASRPFEGQTLDIVFEESPWLMEWTTAGAGDEAFESVRVAAGTFDRALKVEQEARMDFNMALEGMGELAANFTSEANHWFVDGVGLVRMRSVTSSMTLDDMDLPMSSELDLTSTLELKEFRQGVDVSQ